MGAKAQILLVTAALLLPAQAYPTGRVDAADYQAFWLWSGVNATPAMRDADVMYLHQGEVVTYQQRAVFQRLGAPVSRLNLPSVWITVRIATLDMPDEVLERVLRLPERWEKAGNKVQGLQIDFDAATYKLADYATFLQRLRQRLPARFALGVTGLLDWAKTGNIAVLNTLPVDELVVQTYQGRHTVPGYARYLPALHGLRIPFKIGVVEYGAWDRRYERDLAASPYYRGAVVFALSAAPPR